ncbi:hypothetical protein F5Y14DRAFT_417429 [Nemania sp. NC0429]|nr:hypothetical protein F5Y14DRAFT_417429 [Nemania sp. NC0429]
MFCRLLTKIVASGTIYGLFRIIVTVEYQHHVDTTYTVSTVILWAIGEMTSGFLVFCVPTIPKTIGSIGNGIEYMKQYRLRSQESGHSRQHPWITQKQ